MERTAAEWIEGFTAEDGRYAGDTECELAQSLRTGSIELDLIRVLMQHPCDRVRGCVAWALDELTHNVADFLPVVFAGLNDSSEDVRYWCVLTLRQVPVSHRVEAMVRVFGLLEDDVPRVRRAAANVIQMLGFRRSTGMLSVDLTAMCDFVTALSVHPHTFGIDREDAAKISRIQEHVKHGYGNPLHESPDDINSKAFDELAQVGYGIRLGHRCTQLASLLAQSMPTLPPDVRFVLVDRAAELLDTTIGAVRSLATDSDAQVRRRIWLTLSSVMNEVEVWRRKIPTAARDSDKMVREACFSNLTHYIESDVVSAVVDASRNFGDKETCRSTKGVRTIFPARRRKRGQNYFFCSEGQFLSRSASCQIVPKALSWSRSRKNQFEPSGWLTGASVWLSL